MRDADKIKALETASKFLDNILKLQNELSELNEESFSLSESLGDDSNSDINDWCKILRISEKQSELKYRLFVYANFYTLILQIENDKDRFEVQKSAQRNSDLTKEYIDNLIKIGETWVFEDYRCNNFICRWVGFLLEVQELFE